MVKDHTSPLSFAPFDSIIISSLSLSTMTSIKACVISDSYSVFRRMHSYLVMHSLLLSGLDSLVSSNPSLTWKGGMVERMSRAIEVTKKRELTITNT